MLLFSKVDLDFNKMKSTLYASFNYDKKTERLAVFTGHSLMPLKLAQRLAAPKRSEVYKHSVWTITIEDNNDAGFDLKINDFVTTYMNQAAEYVRSHSGHIVELHHWSDVNLGYTGAQFPSLYEPSNYIERVGEVFLLNGFEDLKLQRVFVSGDLSTIEAASEWLCSSNPTLQQNILSSKYALKGADRSLIDRFVRQLSASPKEMISISSKNECILTLPDLLITKTKTVTMNTLSLAADKVADDIQPPKCISRLLAYCSVFSKGFYYQDTNTYRGKKVSPELVVNEGLKAQLNGAGL